MRGPSLRNVRVLGPWVPASAGTNGDWFKPIGIGPKDRQTRMIRLIALSAVLGALVAGVAAYTISPSLWQSVIGPRSGGLEQTTEAKLAPEEWPICTMMVAMP